jgi:hypothetical protein
VNGLAERNRILAGHTGLQLIERNIQIARDMKRGNELAFVAETARSIIQGPVRRKQRPQPRYQSRIAVNAVFQPVSDILAAIPNVFSAVRHIFTPVQGVLAPVAHIFQPVEAAAVIIGIADVLTPVAHILLPVTHVLAAVTDIFAPVTHIFSAVAHVLCPIPDDGRTVLRGCSRSLAGLREQYRTTQG